jgi:hypothetical protein
MVALVVLGFLALVVLLNRRNTGPAPSNQSRERWHWTGPKKKAALIVPAILALVVLVNRLDLGGAPKEKSVRKVITQCRDEQGYSAPCPLPPVVGKDTPGRLGIRVCKDEAGNYIRCPWLPADEGQPRPGG